MIIHVVKPGESVYSISHLYGVSLNKIVEDNELTDPNQLAAGQTLVVLEGVRRHVVAQGQTLYAIALLYDVSVNDIIEANSWLSTPSLIHPGQVITIPSRTRKLGTIEVNGYAYPSTSMNVLRKTLPYLTYLSIFSYNVNPDGSLIPIEDIPLIQAARQARVAPLMVITNRGFSSDVASAILYSPQAQKVLLDNVMQVLRTKNYAGLGIDFEYIYPSDREAYNNFLRKAVQTVRNAGFTISTALAPKISKDQQGILYEAHDYPVHGRLVDHVIIMTYEWGYTYGPPMAVAPLNQVRKVIGYAVTEIPRQKILMGMPNYGYDWTLPHVSGKAAQTLSNVEAVQLAYRQNAAIQYDPVAQSPYFYYYDANNRQHVVWFEDARSVRAKLMLVNEYGLGGVSYWTIGRYFPQNWLVLNSLYNVRKVL